MFISFLTSVLVIEAVKQYALNLSVHNMLHSSEKIHETLILKRNSPKFNFLLVSRGYMVEFDSLNIRKISFHNFNVQ